MSDKLCFKSIHQTTGEIQERVTTVGPPQTKIQQRTTTFTIWERPLSLRFWGSDC